MAGRVELKKVVEKMNLKNLTPNVEYEDKKIEIPDINRPALQLTGYFEHFDSDRVQLIGYVEYTFLETMDEEHKKEIYKKLLSYQIPCIVFSRSMKPEQMFLDMAEEAGIPIFNTEKKTAQFTAEIIRWLIMGESGIGKSEAALELIKRGHRLVSDDVVEIRKVSDETLVGTAPDITRHFIELRGIVIVDVKTLYGVQSVRETQNIDLVITLEDWDKEKKYDRLGMEEEYTEFLGNKVVCHQLPIRPGRNLAIIVETAAINYRQKKMGYNAAQELYKRVQQNLAKK